MVKSLSHSTAVLMYFTHTLCTCQCKSYAAHNESEVFEIGSCRGEGGLQRQASVKVGVIYQISRRIDGAKIVVTY